MAFLSYAQNAEDVVLARAFAGLAEGFYVDVGAGHPLYDSVTKHFYDLGWRGVNIEPLPEECALLREQRPHDVTLEVALSDRAGELPIFVGPPENRGSTTLDGELAERYRRTGERFVESTVGVTTLGAVLEEHVGHAIDFLKLDVEGHEAKVLAGVDLGVWRPRLLVVEATRPNSAEPSEQEWEPSLLACGYHFALFDGINRFYVRDEDRELLTRLSAPANVLDQFVPYRFQHEIDGLREHLERTQAALADAGTTYLEAQDARAQAEGYASSLEDRVRALELELHGAQDEVGRLEDEVTRLERAAAAARRVAAQEALQRAESDTARRDAEAARAELERALRLSESECSELAKVFTTRTFRYSASLRRVYGWVREMRRRVKPT